MCDLLGGCCNDDRQYEWMPSEEPANKAAVEAMRRKMYARDIELPEYVDRGGKVKGVDVVFHLDRGGSRASSPAAEKSSSRHTSDAGREQQQADGHAAEKEPSHARIEAFTTGEGQRLGGLPAPSDGDADADATAKAKAAAMKRMDAPPQGFSASGSRKMKLAR